MFLCSLAVLKLLLEKVCTALTNIPEEAIFPLIDFSGIEFLLFVCDSLQNSIGSALGFKALKDDVS